MSRFRLPSFRIPREGPQRTALNAILAATVLLLLLFIGAQSCSERYAIETEMQRYMKLGPRGGGAALERDLLRDHPGGGGDRPALRPPRAPRLRLRGGGGPDAARGVPLPRAGAGPTALHHHGRAPP
jgi:hypothetical protein